MISYKEEYFKLFAKEKIFESSSFKTLKNNLNSVTLYGPYQNSEDQGFIKDAKEVIETIISIVRKPQITIKTEDSIVRSEQASNIDSTSVKKTLEDSSLWKRKNGLMSPEYVRVNESTDTIVRYENIFICKVLAFINEELISLSRIYEKKIGSIKTYFETDNFSYNKYGVFATLNASRFPYEGILFNNENSTKETSEKVNKLLKRCSTLFSTPFYKEVSKHKANRKEIILTNVLLKDRRYNICYRFYKKYISSHDESYFLPLYQDYVLFRILHDLQDKYRFNEMINDVKISSTSRGLKFNRAIHLQDKIFTFSIKKDPQEYGFIVTAKKIREKYDEDTLEQLATYYIVLSLELNRENLKEYQELLKKKKNEGYDDVCLITLRNNTNYYNGVLTVSFYKDDDQEEALNNLFQSYHMLFVGDEDTYSKICPLCGKRSVHFDGVNYNCSGCKGKWTYITLNRKSYIWVKGFGGK